MRFGVFAVAALLALPTTLGAQPNGTFGAEASPDLLPYSRFSVTPWIGFRVPYGVGDYFVFTETGGEQFVIDEDRGGGAAVGINAEMQVAGPLNVIAGFAYSAADEDRVNVSTSEGLLFSEIIDGPEMWFLKAGVSYRLPDPIPDDRRFHPAAHLFVAPAIVWMDWPDFEGVDDSAVTGTSRHFALNLGADIFTRLNSRLALNLAVEDYITFFDQDRVRERDVIISGSRFEDNVAIDYDFNSANVLMLRMGVTWRH